MRDFLKSSLRWLSVGWLWVVALLALPNCSFTHGAPPPPEYGPSPVSDAIFCDIENIQMPRTCATVDQVNSGAFVSLSHAAVALVTRTTGMGNAALDYSAGALAACNGLPQLVTFQGAIPEGTAVCVNRFQVVGPGLTYADANAVCVRKCQDLNPADSQCDQHALVSTNYPQDDALLFGFGGFLGACDSGGSLQSNFDFDDGTHSHPELLDPRRIPEPVEWDPASLIGVGVSGPIGLTANTLTRTAPATGNFDAGASSTQSMTDAARGDGYVEFSAAETNLSHVCGLSQATGTDTDPSLADIDFGLSLNVDGRVYVLESGNLISGPQVNGSFGTYAAGERFRVTATDNHDGTATIAYSRIVGPCPAGTPCNEATFYTHTGGAVHYPLRVDASFREVNATLTDVRIVRIK